MIQKTFEGIVIFLKDELDILHPYLYQNRYHMYKIISDNNLELFDATEVSIVGNLNKKKLEIEIMRIKRNKNGKSTNTAK